MASTFTPNKHIEEPASGDYNNAWAAPVNANWSIIDAALGQYTYISVAGLSGTQNFTLTTGQYQSQSIQFNGLGVTGANLTWQLPNGVSGMWHVFNNTTGGPPFNINIGINGNIVHSLVQGGHYLLVSDGTTMTFADSALPTLAAAETFATNAANTAQANAEAFATSAAASAQNNAEVFAANANNLTSGKVANGRLPNPGVGPGVTIAPDPGTTPSGSAGQIFYYY